MIKHLTTRQVALALGVSDASLKRWCDKGLIPTVRTVGGHRRLPVSGVIQYLLKSGHPLLRPDLLGMPPATTTSNMAIERCRKLMLRALLDGDEESFHRVGLNLFMAGMKARDIFDRALGPILVELDRAFSAGQLKPYQKIRIARMIERWLAELSLNMPRPAEGAPFGVGCGIEASHLARVATVMMEVVLREIGWRTESLGIDLPVSSIPEVMRELHPKLFWLVIGHIADTAVFLKQYESLAAVAEENGVPLVVTGPDLTRELRQQMRYAAFCDTMGHLVGFARTARGMAVVSK